jgi:hypothetical protein
VTDWTTPQHVTAGDASSDQFNTETVDNLQHLFERLPHYLVLAGTKAIANNTGTTTTVDTLGVVLNDGAIPHSLSGGGVLTLNDGGIFDVSLYGSYVTDFDGITRLVRVVGSTLTNMLAPASQPSITSGIGHGLSASGVFQIPAGETLTVSGRQDAGNDLNLTARLSLKLLAPLP